MATDQAVRRPLWVYLAVTAAGIIVVATILFAVFKPVLVLPRLQQVPPFSLRDLDGQFVTATELVGRPLLFVPFATRDPAAIDTLTTIQTLKAELEQQGLPLQTALITVDPDYDTPERLQDFAATYRLTPAEDWQFLTGSTDAVRFAVGTGLGIYYAPTDDGTVPPHDRIVILADRTGIMRGRYAADQLDPQQLAEHVALLEREAASRGATRVAYEAAHLFMCYPR